MFKRHQLIIEKRSAKRRRIDDELEQSYSVLGDHQRLLDLDELPLRLVRVIYNCITLEGRRANGYGERAINKYREVVQNWLEKVYLEQRIISRRVKAELRCHLSPSDHLKLGIRHLVEEFHYDQTAVDLPISSEIPEADQQAKNSKSSKWILLEEFIE